MDARLSAVEQAQASNSESKNRGWISFSFIIGAVAGCAIGGMGWISNLIVFLINEFNFKSIAAAQIFNVVNGCICLFPVIGAIIADSYLSCFSVFFIFSCFSVLGTVLLTFSVTKRQPCDMVSSFCKSPSKIQFSVLYTGITLATIGFGCTRFILSTMGANQFDKPKDQGTFFNWYFFTAYASAIVSTTVIVYVQDNVSWEWGFGLCAAAIFVGLAIFLGGNFSYRRDKLQGSPFKNIARVVTAYARKRKASLSPQSEDYYHESDEEMKMQAMTPTKRLRFLNRAALKTEGDIGPDGSITSPWRLCTVQHVEDFKTLIRIFPLWSTTLFLSIPIAVQSSLIVLQALTMDRHLGPHFKIPAGSVAVIVLISTSISLTIIDRFICPMWKRLTGFSLTPLQRIGVGHVFNILSMVVSALVETKRLQIAHNHHLQSHPGSIVPMLVLWLFPQLILVGIGEAFHFPGQVALYYQEFPASLQSTATAMVPVIIGVAYYSGSALISLLQRMTSWLPNDINNGRLDNVYWLLVVLAVLNFGYYLLCAKLYKYQNLEKEIHSSVDSDN
ncbi:PTR2 domain-containing protein [Cephalotus follicularis]|uniref:PTR2 domain-containing protein n=1 Tax=Cephalotus follicularis TaxID=3775 RepID=A0A1Q3BTT4_CEPFO|nr:PTR2 domain-containing protein [Cephalotus follicularis]